MALRRLVKIYGKKAYSIKIDLCVTRIELKNSKPCMNCYKYMALFNINRISYSNEEYGITTEKYKDFSTDHISMGYLRHNTDPHHYHRRLVRPG